MFWRSKADDPADKWRPEVTVFELDVLLRPRRIQYSATDPSDQRGHCLCGVSREVCSTVLLIELGKMVVLELKTDQ